MLSKLFNQHVRMIAKYLSNITGFTTHSYLFLTYLLTHWRKFHFRFITFYVSPAACSFLHLTTLVSVSVSLSYGLIHIPIHRHS